MENNQHNKIINNTAVFVQETLVDAEGGHDWFHIERVWKNTQLNYFLHHSPAIRSILELF